MNKNDKIRISVCLIIVDILAIGAAMSLAYHLRILGALFPYYGPAEFAPYVHAVSVALPVWLLIFASVGLYAPDRMAGWSAEFAIVLKASTFGVIALTLLSFLERRTLLSRGWVLLAWALSIGLVTVGRTLFRIRLAQLRRRGQFSSRMLIIGANERAVTIAKQFEMNPQTGTRVVGFLDEYNPPGSALLGELGILGHPGEIQYFVQQTSADEVLVVPDALTWEGFHEIIRRIAVTPTRAAIRLSPGVYEILTTGLKLSDRGGVPVLTFEGIRITGVGALMKSLSDYALGTLILLAAAPCMLVITLAIWLGGAKPVFDRYRVSGLRGIEFQTLKFHTGLLNTSRRVLYHELSRRPAVISHVTGFGVFLYRTGLDKLPQLFNVLAGQMSLVGPRVIPVCNSVEYERWLPNLLSVKPGITGPWAMGTDSSLEDELRGTLYYIRNWSLAEDIALLLKTIYGVLRPPRSGEEPTMPSSEETSKDLTFSVQSRK